MLKLYNRVNSPCKIILITIDSEEFDLGNGLENSRSRQNSMSHDRAEGTVGRIEQHNGSLKEEEEEEANELL